MSIPQQFSKGVAWMAAGSWAEQAINFLVFVVLARLLGAEAFGLLAMASAFVILCEFLVRESLTELLIAHQDPGPGLYSAAFWLLALLGFALTALLWLAAGPLSAWFNAPEVRGLIIALSPTVLLIALTAVPVALMRRELRFRTLSLRAIAGVVTGGVVGIGMAAAGFGVWSLAGQRLATVGTNIVMAWAAVTWRPTWRFSRDDLRLVSGFGSRVLGLRAAELAATQLPAVLIGATMGPAQAGLYAIAWRLVEIASFLIVTPLRMAAQPAFAAMTRAGSRAADLLVDISALSGTLALPAFLGLATLANPILQLCFGADWTPAAPALTALALLGAYLCIEKLHQVFCLAAGRAGAITAIAWGEVALSALMIWLAAGRGLGAVTAAYVATFFILWPLRFVVVARLAGVSPVSLALLHLRPLGAALLMGLGVWALQQMLAGSAAWLGVTLGTLTGILIYGVLTFLTMPDRITLLRRYILAGHPSS